MNNELKGHLMRLPVIVYAYGDTPTVLHVDCVLDGAAFDDPELVRSNLAETLSTPNTLKAGLVVVEIPDEAILPHLMGGPAAHWPVVQGAVVQQTPE